MAPPPTSPVPPLPGASPALCLQCGAGRRLAMDQCSACGYRPETLEDRAAHLMVMDLDGAARQRLAADVRAGGRFEPDPQELRATMEAIDAATPWAVGGFALLVGGVPFLLAVMALLALAWALLPL